MSTYSIALRVRRITYEDAYISVPVTDAVLVKAEDGSTKLNAEAVFGQGLQICQDSRVEWKVEAVHTEVHPTQQAAPEGRQKLDP